MCSLLKKHIQVVKFLSYYYFFSLKQISIFLLCSPETFTIFYKIVLSIDNFKMIRLIMGNLYFLKKLKYTKFLKALFIRNL